jgi:SOS response regulatory protein OraA/RecX
MATAEEWYNAVVAEKNAVQQMAGQIAAIASDIDTIRASVATLAGGGTGGGGTTTSVNLGSIPKSLEDLNVAITSIANGLRFPTGLLYRQIEAHLGAQQDLVGSPDPVTGQGVSAIASNFRQLTENSQSLVDLLDPTNRHGLAQPLLEAITAGGGAGGGGGVVNLDQLIKYLGEVFSGVDPTVGDAVSKFLAGLGDLFVPSAEAAELPPAGTKLTPTQFFEAVRQGLLDATHSTWIASARGVMNEVTAVGAEVADVALAPLGALFESITTAGVRQIIDGLSADALDPTKSVRDRAMSALTRAYKLGQEAHFLAAAVEACHPLHEFGLSNAAAAITDLAGFMPISQAVFRPHLEATVTRPMRWQTNAQFRPEIANVNALNDFVRRRTMSEDELRDALPLHGFDDETCDRYVETVWRDPTIRDLALSLEDTTVDLDWLRDRVRTAGYEDADADRLTAALIQRSTRGIRDRVRSAAVSAYADGTTTRDELEATLDTLGLTAAARALELVTADLQRRRDLVRDGLATYRKEYVNDVIDESDYRLAITALGVDPERVDLIVADANATRAPKVAAEEDQQIKAAIREVQTQLVPKIRRLFELGQVSAETYRQTLIDAGISEQVASQAVSLDAARVRAVTNQHAAGDVQAAIDAVIQARRDLLTDLYRKDGIAERDYRQGLLDSGLARDLVDVMVARENVRKVPAPTRVAAS